MRPLLLWLLAFVMLTEPDGAPVWINKDQVVSIRRSVKGESPGATAVTTLQGTLYVREMPADAARMLDVPEKN